MANKPGKEQLINAIEDWVNKAINANGAPNVSSAAATSAATERDSAKQAVMSLINDLYPGT